MCPLYWRPKPPDPHYLSDELDHVLQKRHLSGHSDRVFFDGHDIPYLQGLLDAGIESARVLIRAVEEHGEIEVFRRP